MTDNTFKASIKSLHDLPHRSMVLGMPLPAVPQPPFPIAEQGGGESHNQEVNLREQGGKKEKHEK